MYLYFVQATWEVEEKKPAVAWPQEGTVQFTGYSNRYRDGLDLVLKDVSFDVKPGEKVSSCKIDIQCNGSCRD